MEKARNLQEEMADLVIDFSLQNLGTEGKYEHRGRKFSYNLTIHVEEEEE